MSCLSAVMTPSCVCGLQHIGGQGCGGISKWSPSDPSYSVMAYRNQTCHWTEVLLNCFDCSKSISGKHCRVHACCVVKTAQGERNNCTMLVSATLAASQSQTLSARTPTRSSYQFPHQNMSGIRSKNVQAACITQLKECKHSSVVRFTYSHRGHARSAKLVISNTCQYRSIRQIAPLPFRYGCQ